VRRKGSSDAFGRYDRGGQCPELVPHQRVDAGAAFGGCNPSAVADFVIDGDGDVSNLARFKSPQFHLFTGLAA